MISWLFMVSCCVLLILRFNSAALNLSQEDNQQERGLMVEILIYHEKDLVSCLHLGGQP
jgi:hypothetical protein